MRVWCQIVVCVCVGGQFETEYSCGEIGGISNEDSL